MKEIKKMAEIYETCIWFLTALAVIAAAILTVPRLAGFRPYIILSSSMEPAIHAGSVVFVNTRDRQVETGDIVTFTMANGRDRIVVTHRIIASTDEGFVTKGDNNETEDLSILKSDRIIGTYAASIPYAGYVMARVSRQMAVAAAAWFLGLHMFGLLLKAAAEEKEAVRKAAETAEKAPEEEAEAAKEATKETAEKATEEFAEKATEKATEEVREEFAEKIAEKAIEKATAEVREDSAGREQIR